MSRDVTFWNLMAKRYAKSDIADVAAYERKLAMTQAVMHPDMDALEFGCGTGSTAVIHAPFVKQMTGIDYSRNMIEIARAKAETVQNLQFEVSELGNWPASNASYDIILGMNILHLLPDHRAALADVRRLIKTGGYFVSTTVCLGDMSGILPRLLPLLSATRLIPKVVPIASDTLAQDIRDAGFEIVENWRPEPGRSAFIIAKAV
ncbi:class I SAM-dependent methyltransferase [Loktanella sp. F6476L]|uniref:class I SAM-dependent methyltransferase n=1 Tax=Loktanella sp. F6476L TaxID=2926405 RepID=UPI001FF3CE4C|nr:class I SAM-dependent methyltransferase [Loktanella sp. F6476L]MCK0119090.1 class I SAM-dependent methyltransferase [Loktanella sp. F6476L]